MPEPFKFIHAADFHLDRPLRGLAELPGHLKSTLVEAPYAAATRVFDLAIAERVDFVLLAGDLVDLERCGPRSVAFLLTQFQRLAEKEIAVYWSTGEVDPFDRWPSNVELPENVVVFSSPIVEDVTHRRKETPIATIFGAGYDPRRIGAADFATINGDAWPIALAYGEFDSGSMGSIDIRYWALGGKHRAEKTEKPDCLVAYPGTPQGRRNREFGPHGCFLCRVDIHGKLRVHQVETDSVRWLPQRLAVDENLSLETLRNALAERALKILTDHPDRTILTNWFLSATGAFNPRLRRQEGIDELIEWLRDEFGRDAPHCLWTTQLSIDPPSELPAEWYEEDTILGEYLRAIGRYQSDESINVSLHEYLPPNAETDEFAGVARVSPARRDVILRQATLLGIDYLAGHKTADPVTAERR